MAKTKKPSPKTDADNAYAVHLAGDRALPIAVIDVGSNSVRLVVFESLTLNPATIYNEKVACGLGRLVATRGKMGKPNIERALRALRRFRMIVEELRAEELHVIATAAVREASDGPIFIAAAEKICKQPISVLSGAEEAEMAASGVRAGIHAPDGVAGDLGGGSLELVNLVNGKNRSAVTLPLGGLRLLETHGEDFAAVRNRIDVELNALDWLEAGRDRPFYAVGGTWRAIARLHMHYRDYPLHVLHQYRISAGETTRFVRDLQDMPIDFFGGAEDISKSRVEVVPYGAAVLHRLIKRMRPSSIVICATGIREGLVYSRLAKSERKEDAFLATCRLLASYRARNPDYADDLISWTDRLFQAAKITESAEEKRLRHAACLVADLGWRSHPDYRSQQSVGVLENAASTSIDHVGIAFLSLVIYFRHEGLVRDDFSNRFRSLIPRAMQKRARILGAAIRAAQALSVGETGILPAAKLKIKDEQLMITLTEDHANLRGERLYNRFKVLAKELSLAAPVNLRHT
ncbi:MAG: Ppx/GppA family phosphatase [Pseudomonadota bacterium]